MKTMIANDIKRQFRSGPPVKPLLPEAHITEESTATLHQGPDEKIEDDEYFFNIKTPKNNGDLKARITL